MKRVVVLSPRAYVGYVTLAFLGGMLLATLIIGTFEWGVGL